MQLNSPHLTTKTLLLVHGAWHNSNCWHKLKVQLEALGHTVIAPDLPGHGKDKTPKSRLSLNLYSKFILDQIENHDHVTLVGHSMGGMIISQVAEIKPEKVSSLVYLAAFLPCHGQSVFSLMEQNRGDDMPTEIENYMSLSGDKRSCSIPPEHIKSLFYSQCSHDDIQQALQDFSDQATLPLSAKVKLTDNFPLIRKTYICCLNDHVIPIAHQRKMILQQPCNEILQLDSDHSPFYSSTNELAKILHAL